VINDARDAIANKLYHLTTYSNDTKDLRIWSEDNIGLNHDLG
jgi:hypothetical protein